MVMKLYIPMLLLGLLLVSCEGKGDTTPAPSATKQAMETTTATGYGKTHEDAYQEAVSQAVSQVCGIDVAKAIVGVPTHTHPTTDDKGVVGGVGFEGVVRSCKVISEEQADDGSFKVTVEAVICPPADVFSKRLALTLPGAEGVARALSGGTLSSGHAAQFAGVFDNLMQGEVEQDRSFVVLDRSSSADDAERSVAGRGDARLEERAKTKGVKAADFVFEVSVSKADEQNSQRRFEVAGRTKYECFISLAYTIKVIDVTTGGVVASVRGDASGHGTAWHENESEAHAASEAEGKLRAAIPGLTKKLLSECKQITQNNQ